MTKVPTCFVAGTPVLVPDDADREAAAELTAIETTEETSNGGLLACGILVAAAGFGGWQLERRQIRRKRREEEELQELIDQLFGGTDLLDEDDLPTSDDDANLWNGNADPRDLWSKSGKDGGGGAAVAECRRATAVLERPRRTDSNASLRMEPTSEPLAQTRTKATARPDAMAAQSRRFGRWWLAGCLLLASLFIGGTLFSSSVSSPSHRQTVAAHSPASKAIEAIRIGQRVVTQDAAASGKPIGTAVDPATWRKVILRADWRWKDRTLDDVNVETLVPPEWLEKNHVRVGAMVPLPLDLVEMGLPDDLQAKVLSVEPCPPIKPGLGRVVLTTVNHLNNYVFGLTLASGDGRRETLRPTGFHKFYSESRGGWVSAENLRDGEQLRGVRGRLMVAGLARVPGVHRVYNMTVEDEHVYRVSMLGALVHNADCYEPGYVVPQDEPGVPSGVVGENPVGALGGAGTTGPNTTLRGPEGLPGRDMIGTPLDPGLYLPK